jgi:hypothetical protein
MDLAQEKRFYFLAEGHALSGHFHRPVPVPIEALASISLPASGGHAHTRVDNFHIPRLVTFKAAYTVVSGSEPEKDTYSTQVTTIIEGLRILDFLTADRIVARLTSERKRQDKHKESHILALGSNFENLRIGGYEVKVILRHDLFRECKTYADLAKEVASDKKSGKIADTSGGATICSLVERIETEFPGLDKTKHILEIPHFGVISLAEVFAVQCRRVLTMVGLKLGSPDGGDVVACQVSSNGQTWP